MMTPSSMFIILSAVIVSPHVGKAAANALSIICLVLAAIFLIFEVK